MTKISESRPPVLGQQHTYTITPGPDPGCRVTFSINGQPVNIPNKIGGLKVVGFGGGSMTVEVTGNFAGTTVEGRIDCPERPAIHAGPIVVGSGSYDNCDQEPCKSLRQSYINAAMLAIDQEKLIKPLCRLYRLFLRLLLLLLLVLLLVTILALVCAANPVFPVLCFALNAIMILLGTAVLALSIYVGLLRRALLQQEVACDLLLVRMKIAYLNMLSDCPRECWIPEVKVKCSCK